MLAKFHLPNPFKEEVPGSPPDYFTTTFQGDKMHKYVILFRKVWLCLLLMSTCQILWSSLHVCCIFYKLNSRTFCTPLFPWNQIMSVVCSVWFCDSSPFFPFFRFIGSDNLDTYFTDTQRTRVAYEILETAPYGKRQKGEIGRKENFCKLCFAWMWNSFPFNRIAYQIKSIKRH